jgi:hypothetical protein
MQLVPSPHPEEHPLLSPPPVRLVALGSHDVQNATVSQFSAQEAQLAAWESVSRWDTGKEAGAQRRTVLLCQSNQALPNLHVCANVFAELGDYLEFGEREVGRAVSFGGTGG